MSEAADWIWLAVAVLWTIVALLRRLARSRARGPADPQERHERHAELDSAEAGNGDGFGPPPIAPR